MRPRNHFLIIASDYKLSESFWKVLLKLSWFDILTHLFQERMAWFVQERTQLNTSIMGQASPLFFVNSGSWIRFLFARTTRNMLINWIKSISSLNFFSYIHTWLLPSCSQFQILLLLRWTRNIYKFFETCNTVLKFRNIKSDSYIDITRCSISFFCVNRRKRTSLKGSIQNFNLLANHWLANTSVFISPGVSFVQDFEKKVLKLVDLVIQTVISSWW